VNETEDTPDIAALRAKLAGNRGKDYWRSLDEAADSESFKEMLKQEFPGQSYVWNQPLSRRELLRLTGATLALAGLVACKRNPVEKILPYAKAPEEIIPGKPLFFATALTFDGYAQGVLVESHLGRPTKIEGNPEHPASLGATDVFMQAAILSMYDPDRSQSLTKDGMMSPWASFVAALNEQLAAQKAKSGAGLRLLTGTVTSPTLAAQIAALLRAYPEARWHQYDPAGLHNTRAGALRAFGQYVSPIYRFDRADRVLSLEADFLFGLPGHLRYTRDFTNRRQAAKGKKEMNRLYVVESTPTVTGTMADHRLRLDAAHVPALAAALGAALGLRVQAPTLSPERQAWVNAVAKDLAAHRGRSLVLAGESQPAAVHALAHAANAALGNAGQTVLYTRPVEAQAVDQLASIKDLAGDMAAGQVDALVILGGNPVYDAPADLNFTDALAKVPFRAHLSLYEDETSAQCHWHIPMAHELEAWGDARAYDGTVSIQQPLIEPLYNGKSPLQILSALAGRPDMAPLDTLRTQWNAAANENRWRKTLHEGVMEYTAAPAFPVGLRFDSFTDLTPPKTETLTLALRPDASLWDGRYANNGWLQELPRPQGHLVWDNAALIAPALAEREKLRNGDVVELSVGGRALKAPVWILPGQADSTVTISLGYGRSRAGQIGNDVGVDAYALRTASTPWLAAGLAFKKTGKRVKLVSTQEHHLMEGRDLVRETTLDDVAAKGFEAPHHPVEGPAADGLYGFKSNDDYAWGMAIDLSTCVGCNACVVGCQAENNIPIVGKDQVSRGREMHWIRLDRYYKGPLDNPTFVHQPVPCMHCENAPCESVCPVEATTHSPEGINEMTYNRCVGTRYCSNNCAYKVRRFNFYQYADDTTPVKKLMYNPNVTVRSRGVMEKCTYCIQRINTARIEAKKDNRLINDGEIKTACQQACPADAIVFGNVKDPESRVAKLKAQSSNYGLLTEMNTRPRTTYLTRVMNPNPEMKDV